MALQLRKWFATAMAALLLAGCVGMTLQDEVAGLMKQGQSLYAEKNYDAALEKFSDVILKDPQHWQAYVWAARVLLVKGDWLGAIRNGQKAFSIAPKGEDVLPVLGEALLGGGTDALKNGNYRQAANYLRDYVKLEPGNADAWLDLAKAYLASGEFGDALESLRKVLKLDPKNEDALRLMLRR